MNPTIFKPAMGATFEARTTQQSSTSLLDALGLDNGNWAVLQENQRSTRYLRTGRGAVAILLLRSLHVRGLWPSILTELANTHRLIIPEYAWPARDVGAWLRGFVDGLGARHIVLVAGDDLALPAAELALEEPERIGSLVLIPESTNEHMSLASYLSFVQDRHTSAPLVLGHTMHDFDAVTALRVFLGDAPHGDAVLNEPSAPPVQGLY